jgi:hypothetical protein
MNSGDFVTSGDELTGEKYVTVSYCLLSEGESEEEENGHTLFRNISF